MSKILLKLFFPLKDLVLAL